MKKNIFLAASICALTIISCKKENETSADSTAQSELSPEEKALKEADKKLLDSVNKVVQSELTTIEFDKKQHDFGTIKEGDKVETTFTIKNTGDKDLFITSAVGSCGCTVPEVTKDAIKPGSSTPILVKFDSKNKFGNTEKTVTISCNTKQTMEVVKIIANVVGEKK